MTRIIVCSAALIAFIVGAKYGLNAAFDDLGFWPGMGICVAGIVAFGIIALLWDYVEGRRSRAATRAARSPTTGALDAILSRRVRASMISCNALSRCSP